MPENIQYTMERAAEARDALNDLVFVDAVRKMKDRYVNTMASEQGYTLTARHACVKLQLLDEFIKELRSAVTEERVQIRRRG